MNQILQQNFHINNHIIHKSKGINNHKNSSPNRHNNLKVEFGNEYAEIPYGGNFMISFNTRELNFFKKYISKNKYQIQFFICCTIASILLVFLFWKLYQNQKQEKIAQELLNTYQLTTLSSNQNKSIDSNKKQAVIVENPFVIGMIEIDKIHLNYPILWETNDDLLKISVCRFAGPMPNQIGNLCIAGHNYIDNRFFSRLNELEIDDKIKIYGLSGDKQEYVIFKKYEVIATDLSCTKQETENTKIVTLLTCDNSSKEKRLVLQAKQI